MNTNKQIARDECRVLDANIAAAIEHAAKAIGLAVVDGRMTCVHCMHFNESEELCSLARARPPAKVIAFGCPAFVPGGHIPF